MIWIPKSPQPSLGDDFEPNYARYSDFGPKCPNMEKWAKVAPRTPKMEIFELFYFYLIKLKIWLPTSPQPASGDDFKPNYARNGDFSPKCPKMEIWAKSAAKPPKMEIFEFFYFSLIKLKIWLLKSPQPALGEDFEPNYAWNSDFGPTCPNMEKWAKLAPDPQKWEFF